MSLKEESGGDHFEVVRDADVRHVGGPAEASTSMVAQVSPSRKMPRLLFVAIAYVVALVVQNLFLPIDFSSYGTAAPALASAFLMLVFGPYLLVAGVCDLGVHGQEFPILLLAGAAHVAFWIGLTARTNAWRWFGRFGRWARGGVVFAAACVSAAGIWCELPTIETYEVSVGGDKVKGNGVRLAVVTDLHSCRYGREQRTLIGMVEACRPDAVLLVGDIFDDRLPDDGVKLFVCGVASNTPCYYVTGNHEYWSDRVHEMRTWMREAGVTVLEGEVKTVDFGGTTVDFCGVDDPTYLYGEWDEQLKQVHERSNPDHLRILLSHRPERIAEYCVYAFDVVVSGHAHGGQWRIPFLNCGLYSPDQGLFPKLLAGKYVLPNGTKMFVSRGLARESTPLPRFFNRPELMVLELKR